MNIRALRIAFVSLALLVFVSQPGAVSGLAQDARQATPPPKPERAKWVAPVAHASSPECSPAGIASHGSPIYPPEEFISNVFIQNYSSKPVTAVRMSWKVFDAENWQKQKSGKCAPAPEAEFLLSGNTPLVEFGGPLRKGEKCYVGRHPRILGYPPALSVSIDWMIVGTGQLTPLMEDASERRFKDDYLLLLYVSEVHFSDGTRWEWKL